MKLSIITINYNNASGLQQTLESVAKQTWRDFEHIVVDGGSTDESVDVIKNYQSAIINHQSSIQLQWVSEKDKGIYNAMNKGIEIAMGKRKINEFNRSELVEDKNKGIRMAEGEYCLFLNSGDWLSDEGSLEAVFQSCNGADIVYGALAVCYADGSKKIYGRQGLDFTAFDLLETPLPHPSSFIKKKLLEELGLYDESYKLAADAKFFIQATVFNNCTVQYIDRVISDFDAYGASSNKELADLEMKRILEELFPPRLCGDYQMVMKYKENMASFKQYKDYIEICKTVKRNWFTRKALTLMYQLLK